jgi:hypothetical protein
MKFAKIFSRGFFLGAGSFLAHPALAQWSDPKSGTLKTDSGLPSSGVDSIVSNLMFWMLSLVGFLAVIGFIISGILYLTAAGNDGQIKTAKTAMTWSIVGVIVALVGYVVIQAVDLWLGGEATF